MAFFFRNGIIPFIKNNPMNLPEIFVQVLRIISKLIYCILTRNDPQKMPKRSGKYMRLFLINGIRSHHEAV